MGTLGGHFYIRLHFMVYNNENTLETVVFCPKSREKFNHRAEKKYLRVDYLKPGKAKKFDFG